MGVAQAIISILINAPALINEAQTLYNAVKGSLSSEDQATVDAALAQAIASDAGATAKADAALDAAAKR
jgi:hypothetical protein